MAVNVNHLKIISVNVNSIITNAKRYSLLQFIEAHDPDIVLLSETKLNPKHKISFESYKMIRTDRPNSIQGGGTGILVKRHIEHKAIYFSNPPNSNTLETSAIKINCGNNKQLIIISIYAAGHNQISFTNELDHLFTQNNITRDNTYFILAGDLNARSKNWGDSTTNSRGRYLTNWLDNKATDLRLHLYPPAEPTFPRSNSFLDVCIADTRIELKKTINDKIEVLDYDSDHRALAIYLDLKSIEAQINTLPEVYAKNYKGTKWSKFQDKLSKLTVAIPSDKNLSNNEIDEYLLLLEQNINNTVSITVPDFKSSNSMTKYINKKITKLTAEKHKTITKLNKIKRTRNPNLLITQIEIDRLKSHIRTLTYEIAKEFSKSCNSFWARKAKLVDYRKPDSFFPELNRMFRPKEQPPLTQISVDRNNADCLADLNIDTTNTQLRDDKYKITDETKILEVLGWHFQKINASKPTLENDRLTEIIESEYKKLSEEVALRKEQNTTLTVFSQSNPTTNPNTLGDFKIFYTPFETNLVIRNIKNKTSSGIDKIPNIVLKHIPINYIQYYTIIFNNIINNCYYPKRWSTAKLLPILKKDKDPHDATSYRPISLMPNISKIFEALLNANISNHCAINKIIPDEQYGFKYKHSTVHAINRFLTDTTKHLNNHEMVAAGLIDLEKAFDSVWLKGLFFKLVKKGFPRYLIRMLYIMMQDRKFYTVYNDVLSQRLFNIEEGLQQGTVNSPILFNIYNSDILNLFNLNSGNSTYSIAFADDLLVYCAGKWPETLQQNLEDLVNKINNYYVKWNLKINAKKCETILIRLPTDRLNKREKLNWRDFEIKVHTKDDSITVPHKQCVKYLGMQIDHLLRLNKHLDIQLKKARRAFRSLAKLFYNKYLEPKAKVICYCLLVRPILSYACPLWYNQSASSMERVRSFERACLRACLGQYRSASSEFKKMLSNKVIYNSANIPRFDNFIIKITRDYFANSKNVTSNNRIKKIADIDTEYIENCKKSGYLPPESFILLDQQGLIQDTNNIPIIYHWSRNKANKKIPSNYKSIPPLKYSTSIPDCDSTDKQRLNFNKYWWLSEDNKFLEDIRQRSVRL